MSAPERRSPAVATACSRSPRDDDRRVVEQRREPTGGRPEEDDEAGRPTGLGACLLEQPLLLGRRMDGEAGARELASGDEHDGAVRTLPKRRAGLGGRRGHPVVDELHAVAAPDDERAQVGEAELLETCRDRSCDGRRGDGGEERLPARPVEARRKRQRPLLPTTSRDDRPAPEERASTDLGRRGEPDPPSRRQGGDRGRPSSSSFATTTSPADCPRAIVSFAAR